MNELMEVLVGELINITCASGLIIFMIIVLFIMRRR